MRRRAARGVGLAGLLAILAASTMAASTMAASTMAGSIPAASTPAAFSEEGTAMWRDLIGRHLDRYPGLEPADLYKLLHQATEGSEHAVGDRASATAWLEREIGSLGPGPAVPEPMVDTLGHGGHYARIHLRPFLASGGDPAALLEAFIATANEGVAGRRSPESLAAGATRPTAPADTTHAELRVALRALESLADEGRLPWPGDTIADFTRARAEEDFPAVHHSEPYRQRYRPAYRVVALKFVSTLRGSTED